MSSVVSGPPVHCSGWNSSMVANDATMPPGAGPKHRHRRLVRRWHPWTPMAPMGTDLEARFQRDQQLFRGRQVQSLADLGGKNVWITDLEHVVEVQLRMLVGLLVVQAALVPAQII